MADTKVSNLIAASALNDADLVPIVQSAASKKSTLSLLKNYILSQALQRNVLINGDFNVWQAGTSFAGLTLTARCADMSLLLLNAQGTWTAERSTDVPTAAQAGRALSYSFKATCTVADATVNAGDYASILIKAEGYDYAPLYAQAQTIQFWVKSNKIGTYTVAAQNDAGTRSYIGTFSVLAANTWERKTITISTAPDAGAAWDFTNGTGLTLHIALAVGSTYHGVSGQWNNANVFGVSGMANLADTLNNYINIADVRLVAGLSADNIYIPSFAEQLAMCQRYYEKTFAYGVAPAQNVGTLSDGVLFDTASGTNLFASWRYTRKRVVPIVTTYNPAAANANFRNYANSADVAVTVDAVGESSASLRNFGGAVDTTVYQIHAVADARL